MAFMEWSERMSVGLAELDDDHKKLIAVINQLEADAGSASQLEGVRRALVTLRRYAEYHFGREQAVMAICNYPALESHIEEHHDFIEKIRGVSEAFEADPKKVAKHVNEELVEFLKTWLTHHILIEDMAYKPYVEGNTKARKAAQSFKGTAIWWSD